MNKYKILNNQIYNSDQFSLVPIRFEDKFEIMKWRNEQMYHLRQDKPLTIENQKIYFNTVISKLFEQIEPSQILFSFLENEICIGYGGLVHINWKDSNAELSFLMNTSLENEFFDYHWNKFLNLIEKVAFQELDFHKIYTYAYDLRPKLYNILVKNNYNLEAKLKEHIFFDNKFIDVLIHSKINGTTIF